MTKDESLWMYVGRADEGILYGCFNGVFRSLIYIYGVCTCALELQYVGT